MDLFKVGSVVELIKQHPSKTTEWEIVFVGIDIKLKSLSKNALYIVIPRIDFAKKVKKVIR